MNTNENDGFWPAICLVCKQTFMSDGEPCCSDVVCQAAMNRQFEQWLVMGEVEEILRGSVDIRSAVLAEL